MPLSPIQSWRCAYIFHPTLEPTAKEKPAPPSDVAVQVAVGETLSALRVAMLGTRLLRRAPLFGVLAGVASTAALAYRHRALWSHRLPHAPSPPPNPRGVLTLGADGFRLHDTFNPWLRIREASFDDHLTLRFFDSREWKFRSSSARAMATNAQSRIQWAQKTKTDYYRYFEAIGLPKVLQVSLTMARRLRDYRRLDPNMQLKVLKSMADLQTRETLVRASAASVRRDWIKRIAIYR